MPSQLKVFVFLALTIASRNVIGKEYTVLPTEIATAACTSAPVTSVHECSTLLHYLENSSNYFSSGSVFSLQPGLHSLHGHSADNGAFVIKDIHNLTLRGPSDGKAVVNCSGSAGLAFSNISGLTLESITIEGCSMNITHSFLAQQSMENLTASLLGNSISLRAGLFLGLIWNLTLSKVSIQYCKGYGMIAVNLVGDTQVSSVNFLGNNFQSLYDPLCKSYLLQHCKGGNLLFIYSDFQSHCPELLPSYTLTVYNSTFKHGVDLGPAYPLLSNNQLDTTAYLGGAGIGVSLTQTTYRVKVTIKECTLVKNAAYIGANLYVTIFENVQHSSVAVQHSRLQYGNNIHDVSKEVDSSFTVGSYTMASGFYFTYGLLANIQYYQAMCTRNHTGQQKIFSLHNCTIAYNKATLISSGFVYFWGRTLVERPLKFVVDNCSIHDNIGSSTFTFYELSNPSFSPPFHLLLNNSSFFHNENRQRRGNIQIMTQDMIVVNSLRYLEVVNCSFFSNSGSAIRAIDSAVLLDGINQFTNNVGLVGAGLNLQDGSTINLKPRSITIFKNNRVRFCGGAINAVTNSHKCFFQVLTNSLEEYPQLVFENNTAEHAGDAVYGDVDKCYQIKHEIKFTEVDNLFANISTIDLSPGQASPISNVPFKLCLCAENKTNFTADLPITHFAFCRNSKTPLYFIYPGQTFTVAVAALGYYGHYGSGFTPATVHTTFSLNNLSISMKDSQTIQQLRHDCSTLKYTLYSMPQTVQLNLIPENGKFYFATYVNVTILPCPIGFQLSLQHQSRMRCVCHRLFEKKSLTCDIQTQKITRSKHQWLGIIDNYITPQAFTIGNCPSTYCNQDILLVSFNNTNEQCMPHRSGILCGSCQQGYSVAIGSSKCLQCSNYYLFFLILFAIFGVLLILFLSVTNLTTATGMINALLFYANIIKINNLPKYTYGKYNFLDPFSIFISWLNLDFGIETCLYDGLNVYVKAWLQYVFPLYLFFLLFLLTAVSNRSTKISKVLPTNIIAVFATVLLISYTKLFRCVMFSLPNIQLSTLNESYLVWWYDGSFIYFGRHHAPLVIFSIIVFFGIIFPYVVILLIHPFLQNLAANEDTCTEKLFSWIRFKLFHLKPIFDAYEAPYMSSHRYWTGLLLGLRIVALATLSSDALFTSQITTSSAVITMSCALLFMVLVFRIYTSKLVRAFECAHYINLAMLEFIGLILQLSGSSEGAKAIVLTFSISFCFVLFAFSAFIQVFWKLRAYYPKLDQWSKMLHEKLSWRNCNKKNKDLQEPFIQDTCVYMHVTHSSISRPIYLNENNDDVKM